jgi:hypothetical protein
MIREYSPVEALAQEQRYLEAERRAINAICSCDLTIAEHEHYLSRLRRELDGETPAMKRVICLEWLDWARRGLRSCELPSPQCQNGALDMVNLP